MSECTEDLGEVLYSLAVLSNQNKAIISLLSRIENLGKGIREEITKGKRRDTREGYIRGYNACDGTQTQSEIANIIGVDVSTFSRVSDVWEELGIVYTVPTPKGKSTGKYYRKIFPIDV